MISELFGAIDSRHSRYYSMVKSRIRRSVPENPSYSANYTRFFLRLEKQESVLGMDGG